MSLLVIPFLTDTWARATWDEYLGTIDDLAYPRAKGYYYDGRMKIEMARIGHDHAADNTVGSFAVNLFCGLKSIPTRGLTNCTYRKVGYRDAQPDISYYIGANSDIIPWGTTIVDLDQYPAPDLAIEIASTSISDDIGEKRLLYEDLQVKEYWVVDVQAVQILAFAIADQGSRRITKSQVLPGLAISLLQEAFQRTRQMNQSQVVNWLLAEFQKP